jgi:hypothetical protein
VLSPAAGAAAARGEASDVESFCALIETAATDNEIPIAFFVRLLWKESNFRSEAVSPKGAQGIAQFMPGTADERDLLDPFDVETAIPASARFLSDLKAEFGNLGLAAAAYNAGAKRVTDWLAGSRTLPLETQDYVLWITGTSAEDWATAEDGGEPAGAFDEGDDCRTLVATLKIPDIELVAEIETTSAPWGAQVAGNFSRARAIVTYASLQSRYPSLLAGRIPMIIAERAAGRGTRVLYQVRVPAASREEAEEFCSSLQAVGGSCVVLRT